MTIIPPGAVGLSQPARQADTSTISETEKSFSDFVTSSIEEVDRKLANSDKAIESLHNGQAQNLHEVMIAVEEADVSLRMFVQIRNKALQAYEEILRLQI